MAALQSWRKAYGALKDTTTVSLANLNSDFKDLDVAIVRATNHVESPPKERHLRKVVAATSIARPRADVTYCIHALARRLAKTRNWIVALKTLVVIHRLLREGDPAFREEFLTFTQRVRILQLSNFKDDSSPVAWDYSSWVRTYGLFLEEKLECFRVLKYDIEAARLSKQGQGPEKGHSRTTELNSQDLLEQLPALQQLLYRLIGCRAEGAANNNYLVQYALALVLKESFKIYCAINDGIINLIDKFFEMPKHEALKALDVYKRAIHQELPERLLLTYKPEEEEVCDPVPIVEEKLQVVEELAPVPSSQIALPPKPEIADTGDLLGLGDSAPTVSAIEESNALALAILPTGIDNTTTTTQQDSGFDPTGWELALVTTSSNVASLSMESNLGGGFDKLTLDSLYDDGTYRQMQQQQLYGSAPPNPFMASDPFAVSNQVAPPPSVQMAAMAPQPRHLPMMIEPNPFGPPQQHHAGVAPAANPFLDAGFGAFPAANGMHPQTNNPFGGAALL